MHLHNKNSKYNNVVDGLTVEDILEKIELLKHSEINVRYDYNRDDFESSLNIDHKHYQIPIKYNGNFTKSIEELVLNLGDPLNAKFGGKHFFLDYGCVFVLKIESVSSAPNSTYTGMVIQDKHMGLITIKKELTKLKMVVKPSHYTEAKQLSCGFEVANLISTDSIYGLLQQEENGD